MQTIFYIFAAAILLINLSIGITFIKTNKNAADKKALQNYGYKMGISLIVLSVITAGILIIIARKLF